MQLLTGRFLNQNHFKLEEDDHKNNKLTHAYKFQERKKIYPKNVKEISLSDCLSTESKLIKIF